MLTCFYRLPWSWLLLVMPGMTMAYGCIRRRRDFSRWYEKAIMTVLLALWVGLILRTTVLNRETGAFAAFQPLFESYRVAKIQPEIYRSNFMNILLFFPGGMLLYAVIPGKNWVKFTAAVALMMLLSVAVEYSQFLRGTGLAEMDDILHNALGAGFGAGAAWFSPWAMCNAFTWVKLRLENGKD